MEEDKTKKEQEKNKELQRKTAEKLHEEQAAITKAEHQQHSLLSSSNVVLHEAEAKLSSAIKMGNVDQIAIAHGLLEVANKRVTEVTSELSKLAEKRETCLSKLKRHSLCESTVEDKQCKKAKLDELCHKK
jgi:hypothetical protein